MALKTILVALSTVRDGKRVRFAAGSVVSLTAEEQDSLQKLQDQSGKLHFRTPVNEGGKAVESKPEAVDNGAGAEFEGAKVPVADKTVVQLKAYLDFHKVEYKGNASRADLVTLAETFAATAGDGGDGAEDADPDAGL